MDKKVRKTTYQKIKEERAKLYNDIRVMIMSPDSVDAAHLRIKYKLEFDMEDIIMFGDVTKQDKSQGLMDFITKNK